MMIATLNLMVRRKRTPEEQLADLEAQLASMKSIVRDRSRFSSEAVREDRDRLELSAANYAELVGVSMLTIYSWEHGRTEPRADQLKKWLEVTRMSRRQAWEGLGLQEMSATGFSPDAVYAERDRLELSAAAYGQLVGVSMLTIYNWEKGKSQPRDAQLQKWQTVKGIGKRKAWKSLGLV